MRERVEQWLRDAFDAMRDAGHIGELEVKPKVVASKTGEHGDWASNIALTTAEAAGMPPRALAALIIRHLPEAPELERAVCAGPGFINFFVKRNAGHAGVRAVLGDDFGAPPPTGAPRKRALIEFVSANPTGPLHVGHGRGAAYGACVADLLERAGWEVEREYYVNDAGRQMDILALSVWLRYLALGDGPHARAGEDAHFPPGAYGGDYIWDVAARCRRERGAEWERDPGDIAPRGDADDKDANEERLTRMIAHARGALGDEYDAVKNLALGMLRGLIEDELRAFGVRYDNWFPESAVSEKVDEVVSGLKKSGALYEDGGALWFRSSRFGDVKDRVVVRADGRATYFATDIAYHLDKYRRGYDKIINIWGADHHGYVARLNAAVRAMGLDVSKLEIILVQFVNLLRDGKRVAMSTRAGEFVTLRELCAEVGADAARFFYVERKPGRHMDFDLSLAKARNNENPLYYVQYAHARICSVFRQLEESGGKWDAGAPLEALTREDEAELARQMSRYDEVLAQGEPHRLVRFLHTLAGAFHAYYDNCRFLVDDDGERAARLALIAATRKVLADGLRLIGVSAPDKM